MVKLCANFGFVFYRHHQHGRWQARIGRVAGNKDLYLGTFGKIHTFSKLHEALCLSTFSKDLFIWQLSLTLFIRLMKRNNELF